MDGRQAGYLHPEPPVQICTCCGKARAAQYLNHPYGIPIIGWRHEIEALNARGVDTSLLRVSANAHVIPPYNTVLDRVTERFLGSRKIGTTGRGIGPTYADKMSRVGIRVQDLYDESILRQKVGAALEVKNQLLAKIYNRRAIDADAVVAEGRVSAAANVTTESTDGLRSAARSAAPPPIEWPETASRVGWAFG